MQAYTFQPDGRGLDDDRARIFRHLLMSRDYHTVICSTRNYYRKTFTRKTVNQFLTYLNSFESYASHTLID